MILNVFTAFNVLLYYTDAYLYFAIMGLSPIRSLYWYFFSIGLGVLLVILKGNILPREKSSKTLFLWAICFFSLVSISYIFSTQSKVANLAIINTVEIVSLMLLFILLLQEKSGIKLAYIALIPAVMIAVFMNHIDFFSLLNIELSNVPGRAAGLYRNANISGKLTVFGMVLSVFYIPKKIRFIYCVFIATGVVLTFSRSAIMLWGIAVTLLAWFNVFALPRKISIGIIAGVFMVLLASLLSGGWVDYFEKAGVKKYLSENAKNRIGGSFFGQKDISTKSRIYVAKKGLEKFLESPLYGHGLASSLERRIAASTHNMYLRYGLEQGILGVLLILWLIRILWKSSDYVGKIIATLFFCSSFFSHNNLDQPAMVIILALTILGARYIEKKEQPDKVNQQREQTIALERA